MFSTYWRIVKNSARLELKFILGNKLEQVLLLWLPALVITVITLTFSNTQIRDVSIGVVNYDNSQSSRALLRMVNASPNVEITKQFKSIKDAKQALQTKKIYGILTIPKNFSRNLKTLQKNSITLNVNAQYGTHSGIIQSGVGAAVRTFSAAVKLKIKQQSNGLTTQAKKTLMPIGINTTMAFNLSLSYLNFLASNIIPALLHILATVVGAGLIGRHLRDKSLDNWIDNANKQEKSQPFLAMFAALSGKFLWPGLAFLMWSIVTSLLFTTQHALSSVIITNITFVIFLWFSLWLGNLLTLLFMSFRMGLSVAGIITAPAFSFTGVTYPVAAMPFSAQVFSAILPLTYYLQASIGQIQMHLHWTKALPTTLVFAGLLVLCLLFNVVLSLKALKRSHKWGQR